MPLAKICNENFVGVRNRILMKNVCYAGVLCALLDIELDVIRQLLAETFAKKQALVDSNMKAVQLGYDYASSVHPRYPLPIRVSRVDRTAGHVTLDRRQHRRGPRCVYAGATVGAWYPITPRPR